MVHQKRNLMISLVAIGSLTACAVNTPPEVKIEKEYIYITPKFITPKRPSLPTWKGSDMECLDDSIKSKISERDRMRKEYAEDLEAILNSISSQQYSR